MPIIISNFLPNLSLRGGSKMHPIQIPTKYTDPKDPKVFLDAHSKLYFCTQLLKEVGLVSSIRYSTYFSQKSSVAHYYHSS